MTPRYYEEEACIVAGCSVSDMFSGRRKREFVLARQLSMIFRMESYSEPQAKVAARFGMDHATCVHVKKAINAFKETNKDFKVAFDSYMKRCYYLKARLEPNGKMQEKLNELGVKEFIRQNQENFTTLSFVLNEYLMDKRSEKDVAQFISNTEAAIGELKFIFEV